MGWKSKELNVVEFVEGEAEELVFSGVDVINAKDGKSYDVLNVVNAMGEDETYFLSGHLKYLVEREDLEKGDRIKITYLGLSEKEIKTEFGDKKIHKYRLEVWEDDK